MEKKMEERRDKRRKKKTSGEVGVMSRWLETDHIQSQQTFPLFTEGRLKGSNVKDLQHF